MTRAIEKITDTFIHAATPTAPTPSTGLNAISAIEKDKLLSKDEIFDACDIVNKDPGIGETYLALSKPRLRAAFLRRSLNEYRTQKLGGREEK